MSEAGKSTQIGIPDALTASVEQATQYGMRFPDGSVEWNTVSTSRGTVYVQHIVEDSAAARHEWAKHLKRKALDASVNPVDYSNGHKIVARVVVLAVTAAMDHTGNLRPWNPPAKDEDWEAAVPSMKAPAAPWE